MAQPDSQGLESEDLDPSETDDDSASLDRSGAAAENSLQSDVEALLDSVDFGESGDLEEDETEEEGQIGANETAATPNSDSDDLLMRAGSILNGGETEIPVVEPHQDQGGAELAASEEESGGLMSMPDPQSLVFEDADEEGAEETSKELAENPAAAVNLDTLDDSASVDSDETDGDVLPSSPAPVALEEEEIISELATPEREESESSSIESETGQTPPAELVWDEGESEPQDAPVTKTKAPAESPEPAKEDSPQAVEETEEAEGAAADEDTDTFEVDDGDSFLLDDDDAGLFDDSAEEEIIPISEIVAEANDSAGESVEKSDKPSASPKEEAGKWSAFTKSVQTLPFAASIALFGLGLLVVSLKSEIVEWLSHGDVDGTALSHKVAAISEEVFETFSPNAPYRMAWLETRVKRISDSEIRVDAQIGAELLADLYLPVDESALYQKLPFGAEELTSAARRMQDIGRDDIQPPRKAWTQLYKLSAAKGESFPFLVSCRFLKGETDSEWTLSGLRVKESEGGFAWSQGRPKSHFGDQALDLSSMDFASHFRAYENAGMAFLNRAAAAEKAHLAMVDEKAQEREEKRRELIMALSQGSYFKGMAIVGEKGDAAKEVSLIITETRANGGLVKGVLKLEGDGMPSKHFTGFVDVVDSDQGVQGRLDLTTIAFAGQVAQGDSSPFFNPGTAAGLRLQTDGIRMWGSTRDLSLRLTRNL